MALAQGEMPTIPAAYARLLFDYLRALGLDPARVLPAAQVRELETTEAHALTSRAGWLAMLGRITGHTDDPDLALKIGEAFRVRHMGLAGYVLVNCATLGEAGAQFGRYHRLMGDAGGARVQRLGDMAEVTFEWSGEAPPPAMDQLWAAATVSLGAWLTGRADLRWQAHFRFPRPARVTEYERLFGSEPRFGQPATKLVFPAWVMDLPIVMGSPDLRRLAELQAESALQALEGEPALLRRTRLAIAENLATGGASLEQVAQGLGLSPRTLHRRLTEQGSSFRMLSDAVRRSRAESYLRNPAISLVEIAFMLGYTEQSTFQHAFRRWTGMTPGEFRLKY